MDTNGIEKYNSPQAAPHDPKLHWLDIIEEDGGFYLLSLDDTYQSYYDSFHDTIEDAKEEAILSYSVNQSDWVAVKK